MMWMLSALGAYGWHVQPRPPTARQRILGQRRVAQQLCAHIFAYQVWDFCASVSMEEHRSLIFLLHHVASATTAYMTLVTGCMHTYALFFGGCSEISTLALVWVELDKYFPTAINETSSAWQGWIFFNQVMFVVLFVAYRLVGWFTVSRTLWADVGKVMEKDMETYRGPSTKAFVYAFLGMDVSLGLLQVYWFGTGLVPRIISVVQGILGL